MMSHVSIEEDDNKTLIMKTVTDADVSLKNKMTNSNFHAPLYNSVIEKAG